MINGTEKQIEYAIAIREKALATVQVAPAMEARRNEFVAHVTTNYTNAAHWIEAWKFIANSTLDNMSAKEAQIVLNQVAKLKAAA